MAISTEFRPLGGSERVRTSSARLVEALRNDELIGITILVRSKPGAPPLPDLAHWQATAPGDRKFLSPDEYADTYGAADEDLDAVTNFALDHAMTVVESHSGRRSVTIQGTAAQMNAAFNIKLNRYEAQAARRAWAMGPDGKMVSTYHHHGYDGPVHLPPELADIVTAVVGLDNRRGAGPAGGTGDPAGASSLQVPVVAGLYNFPNPGAVGQTIGIHGAQPTAGNGASFLASDINNLYFPGLTNVAYQTPPASINAINLTVGGTLYFNNTAAVRAITATSNLGILPNSFIIEVTQDIATSATIAQGATVNVYFTSDDEQGWVVFLNRVLQPPAGEAQPTVITSSFPLTLSDDTLTFGASGTVGSVPNVLSTLFQQLAAVGINAFTALGDWGSDDQNTDGKTHVSYPGSEPFITSCGGTILAKTGATFNEVVWSDSNSTTSPFTSSPASDFGSTGGGASGGGIGANFPIPPYQTAAGLSSITDSAGNVLKARFVPDVAGMVAYTGFFANGRSYGFVGTSCVSPLYAGLAAVLRGAFGVNLGFLNPTLYQLGKVAFNDVSSGNNDSSEVSPTLDAPFFTAAPGAWDPVSGWGSIDGTKLLNGIAGLLYNQTFYFNIGKDNYGLDEVKNVATYPQAFWLTLEGFTPTTAGVAEPTLAGAFFTQAGVTITVGPAVPEIPTQVSTPQRIAYFCQVAFAASAIKTTAQGGIFPVIGAAPISLPLTASFTIGGQSFVAATVIQLLGGADPYFLNINPSQVNAFYLSQDVRVFTATPGLSFTPISGVGTPPSIVPTSQTALETIVGFSYIQALIKYLDLNYSNPAGVDPFVSLFPDQNNALTGDSSVSPTTPDPSSPLGQSPFINYNFAVARVRLNGTPGSTTPSPVRVFFRLFATQSNDTDFQPDTTYFSAVDGSGRPQVPGVGKGNTTLPFYATGNNDANNDFGLNVDYAATSVNDKTITIGASGSVWAYFGCYLNLYPPLNILSGQPVLALLTGTHHCLVAQIAFDGAPIVNSNGTTKGPENSDKLAQRNLQVTLSDNPGPPETHRVPQTFDVRPSIAPAAGNDPLQNYPDELMIDWGSTPPGSVATIFWPQVKASDVLALAKTLYSTHQLSAADPNTIQCRTTSGVTYVPIPPSPSGENYAGLFTIDLPQGVVTGQEFNIVVRRLASRQVPPIITGPKIAVVIKDAAPAAAGGAGATTKSSDNWRYAVGSFAVKIPVSTPDAMLRPEEDTLAIMKWRLSLTAPSSRWFPVLMRYLELIAARVDGLGGDSGSVPASPGGFHPAPPTAVKVVITFPPNFHRFLVDKPIEIRGNATWQPPGPSPVVSMQLTSLESRFNGIEFGPFIHVNDFILPLTLEGDHTVIWEHFVVPFDGRARYKLTAFAFGADNKEIGKSEPLFIESVVGDE